MLRTIHTPALNGKTRNTLKTYHGKPIAEIIVNGFFTIDKNWTVRYCNKAADELLGVSGKNNTNKNVCQQFVKLVPRDFYTIYRKAILRDTPVKFQEYWTEKAVWFDVEVSHYDKTLYVSFKNSGAPPIENSIEQLSSATDLYRFVTEITNDCLWEWNLSSEEMFWIDGGHKRVFGYPIENSLVPISFWKSCLHPDDRVRVLDKLNQMISTETKSVWEDEYRFKTAKGNYIYVHDRGHIVFDENNTASTIIGATQDINDRILLENEITAQKTDQHREITSAVITALENERSNIGKELHDNLGQVLSVAKMYIQMSKRSEQNRESNIDKSLRFVSTVIDEIRKISKTLVIPAKHIISLADNIKILVKDVMAVHPIKIKFDHKNINSKDLNDPLQVTIYRIIQEQLSNILKHSRASRALIRLQRKEDDILLLISDNGIGVDIANEKKGVGIMNIRSRVELHHGIVTFTAEPGNGYELKATFSLAGNKMEE